MKSLFTELESHLAAGARAVLCVIVSAAGSTPRREGALMAAFADGTFAGTIGGGIVEYQAQQRAQQVLREGSSCSAAYSLRANRDDALGMICGGDLVTAFLSMGPEELPLVRSALERIEQHKDCWLVVSMVGWSPNGLGLCDREAGIQFLNDVEMADLSPLLQRRPVRADGTKRLLTVPLSSSARVYVLGGGHVAQALVPLLAQVDFPVVVLENRQEFADPARFPDAERVQLTTFSEFAEGTAVSPRDGIVVMTRGHRDDYAVLCQALQTQAGYVGVIGSRRKAALTMERLMEDGFSEEDRRRVHTPIGLPIGAETPAEIAVSIAAELIRFRAGL